MLRSVAVLYHPQRPAAVNEADWLREQLRARGVEVLVGDGWDPEAVRSMSLARDLLVALGGDGTILHVARLAAPFEVPILGINLGRVGFLAELTPETLHHSVEALIHGRYWIEERCMLDVTWETPEEHERFLCLNEVAIARGASARAVHVDTRLNGHEFMTYTADAVLVATATGSTAYSLAAGGPILYPEARDLMITPVAPHLHIGRSIIVPGTMTATVQLSSDRPALVTIDGCDERVLRPDHQVHVSRSETTALFARLGPRQYFYQAIAARLQ